MNFLSLSCPRLIRITYLASKKFSSHSIFAMRKFCSDNSNSGTEENSDSEYIEAPLKNMWGSSYFDLDLDERTDFGEAETSFGEGLSTRQRFFESTKINAERVLQVLRQDGRGFDTRSALDELEIRVSGLLVRKVLLEILKNINQSNKIRSAKLGFKFFVWSGQQGNYEHTVDSYHSLMKIFGKCEEFKAMIRLVDEMTEKGLPTSARTLNILICTCGEAGLAQRIIERFIKSKTFRFRPFKHSFNAILLCLLVLNQYKLIEWVHEKMLDDGHSPDILTYNIMMVTKYRLGKLEEFHRLLDEMDRSGFSPDLHTYNILLHVLGKGDKPLAAINLLNHMREMGVEPRILHYTTLIDGLSRAGNLDACKFFFDEIPKNGCSADVVCYTVMIAGYVAAGKLEKAQEMFAEMIDKGQAPNVFTYKSMVSGLCQAGKFDEACSMVLGMESRGCSPNFLVYSTLVGNLQRAGKLSEAHQIVRHMAEKGKYIHLIQKLNGYK